MNPGIWELSFASTIIANTVQALFVVVSLVTPRLFILAFKVASAIRRRLGPGANDSTSASISSSVFFFIDLTERRYAQQNPIVTSTNNRPNPATYGSGRVDEVPRNWLNAKTPVKVTTVVPINTCSEVQRFINRFVGFNVRRTLTVTTIALLTNNKPITDISATAHNATPI